MTITGLETSREYQADVLDAALLSFLLIWPRCKRQEQKKKKAQWWNNRQQGYGRRKTSLLQNAPEWKDNEDGDDSDKNVLGSCRK